MGKEAEFRALFKPFDIRGLQLKNRIVMAPMTTGLASAQGFVSEALIGYYEKRAAGGVGLIIVEGTGVGASEVHSDMRQLTIGHESFVPALSNLVDSIHGHGAKAALQLDYVGTDTPSYANWKRRNVCGAEKPGDLTGIVGRLTRAEVEEIVNQFAKGARRAKKAGFDAVELCGCHGSLIAQFLSSYTNHRSDDYGGSVDSRSRFFLEILHAVKESAGRNFPVLCRINAIEYGVDGAITLDEAKRVSHLLEKAGADVIDVTVYGYGDYRTLHVPYFSGILLPIASVIKESIGVPVIGAGQINPEMGNRALRGGMVDLVGIGRGLIADPEWTNKVNSGRIQNIRPCISCLNCLDRVASSGTLECTVNPELGVENEWQRNIVTTPAKILVIGGGPAGMEAARVSAMRGHDVTLCEKTQELGGQLGLAAKPPYKNGITTFLAYLRWQINEAKVSVEIGKEATIAVAKRIGPDAIIVATGAAPDLPEIPGAKDWNAVLATDVLKGEITVGQNVIVIGSQVVAWETADLLVELGKKVTIVTATSEMSTHISSLRQAERFNRLSERKVKIVTGVTYRAITENGLHVVLPNGEEQVLVADTMIVGCDRRSDHHFVTELKSAFSSVYQIGDIVNPRGIKQALKEGFMAGCTI